MTKSNVEFDQDVVHHHHWPVAINEEVSFPVGFNGEKPVDV